MDTASVCENNRGQGLGVQPPRETEAESTTREKTRSVGSEIKRANRGDYIFSIAFIFFSKIYISNTSSILRFLIIRKKVREFKSRKQNTENIFFIALSQ